MGFMIILTVIIVMWIYVLKANNCGYFHGFIFVNDNCEHFFSKYLSVVVLHFSVKCTSAHIVLEPGWLVAILSKNVSGMGGVDM